MDPAGILMLQSVRIVFEMIGIKPESVEFIGEKFDSDNIVKALTQQPKKCPAIVTADFTEDRLPHIMVATNALQGRDFPFGPKVPEPVAYALQNEWFILQNNLF